MNKDKIVVLTTVHSREDTRVFHKQARDLGKQPQFDVTVVVADGHGDEGRSEYNIVDLGKPNNRFLRFLVSGFKAYRTAKSLSPKVVHFHDPELMLVACALSMSGIRIIFDVHENVPEDIKDKYWIPSFLRSTISFAYVFLEKLCLPFFHKVFAATPDIMSRYPSDKAVLVQNYPSLSEFDCSASSPSSTNNNYIVYLGAITKIRGIDNIVRALNLINAEKDHARFRLAGFFQESGHLEELSLEEGWRHVDFIGPVKRHDVPRLLSGARCGLVTFLPANNHINAQPNKLFEYMAAGIPLIASDFRLWREIVKKYDCGILVDPESPENIADAVLEILENPQRSTEMGTNGKRAVFDVLNWEVESKKMIQTYRSLLQGCGNVAP
ncbi:glycosyltransferase family 4 protein [Pseudomonas sp. QE6]|uniref:glycosyltransferase family 4 protein n=1 Tax=Pseudomonas sp. QE6 TaxID=3242491 RepID=UPI003526C956